MPNVLEPDEGIVHASSATLQSAVTLCGKADWGATLFRGADTPGEDTDDDVTCRECLSIIDHCHRGYRRDGTTRTRKKRSP